ncbi:MAG: hypothetical protein AAF449_02665 [Myxococcota bacterium]
MSVVSGDLKLVVCFYGWNLDFENLEFRQSVAHSRSGRPKLCLHHADGKPWWFASRWTGVWLIKSKPLQQPRRILRTRLQYERVTTRSLSLVDDQRKLLQFEHERHLDVCELQLLATVAHCGKRFAFGRMHYANA